MKNIKYGVGGELVAASQALAGPSAASSDASVAEVSVHGPDARSVQA